MRTFLALDLPGDARQNIEHFLQELKDAYRHHHIRWSEANQLHITLEFFGERSQAELQRIQDVLSVCIDAFREKKFAVAIDNFTAFPHPKKPRVLILQVYNKGEYSVKDLQRNVHNALLNQGIELQNRVWKPHITLGRISDKAARLNMDQFTFEPITLTIPAITLYKSELHPDGAVYTPIKKYTLHA